MPPAEVVVTGMGVVSPIGIGARQFAAALSRGQSGIRPLTLFDCSGLPTRIGGEIPHFDPRAQGIPRKSLKVMPRDAQIGVSASLLACRDGSVCDGGVDPERFGIILGAERICGSIPESAPAYRTCMTNGRFDFSRWGQEGMPRIYPLSFLRVLPNMVASHISIIHDARGPNNTIHHGEVSSLLAVSEAAQVIGRGMADVMLAGGASSQMDPYDWVWHCTSGRLSPRHEDPASVMRPFDAARDGEVRGEGAAVFLLETRTHAQARGATILARVAAWASAFEPHRGMPATGTALCRAMGQALDRAGLGPGQIGHVNAQGWSTRNDDPVEAAAIHAVLPGVPVTAPRSYFGNLGAAAGATEMAVSVLAFSTGLVPPTLNYERPDPACPVRVVREEPLANSPRTALLINWTRIGQAAAVVLTGPE